MRILIVDDHEENNYYLKSLLESKKHTVFEASNGLAALEVLGETEIDLIISDILMPVMDGFTLCREVRNSPATKHIPFVTYTATYTGQQDEELALKIGANAFIVKPCEPDVLLQKIDEISERTNKRDHEFTASDSKEQDILKLYNDRLVRKLEKKMLEAEKEAQILQVTHAALKRSEGLLKATQKLSKIGGWEWDVVNSTMFWTEELYLLHDLEANPRPELGETLITQSLSCYPEDAQLQVNQAFQQCCETGEPFEIECWFTTFKGRKLYIRTAGTAVIENDQVVKVYGDFQDITERKLAGTEQAELRIQLHQVQKLDSIGQLAGGVAHDFNNILTVILGYAEDVSQSFHPDDPLAQDLQEIIKAGLRATTLTRQLLTFSRKQAVQPQLLNLNKVIDDMHRMLLRLIGEDVSIDLLLNSEIGYIKADIGQIEQVILNLGINARDAMPSGGTLTIETNNITTTTDFCRSNPDIPMGDYSEMKISDTGLGMDIQTMERIFEPFYTTKEKNSGTGLGLATVYGIVRQAEGHIRVCSMPEEGSCFTILFPRIYETPVKQEQSVDKSTMPGSNEHIFVVEDDLAIRELTGKICRKLGYQVNMYDSAEEALLQINKNRIKPNLVITDVVMPGMSGVEFVAILQERYPQLKLLLMSGYSEKVISQHGDVDPKIPFLQKPFTHRELAEKVKIALA